MLVGLKTGFDDGATFFTMYLEICEFAVICFHSISYFIVDLICGTPSFYCQMISFFYDQMISFCVILYQHQSDD